MSQTDKDINVPSNWISVNDRLPEEPLQTVIVTNGKESCVAVYSVVYDEFGVMCGKGKTFGVTHWMPLPEPPSATKKTNDGTIATNLTYIWLYESDRHGNRWSRCQKCHGCVDGFVHYPYCPYCGEKMGG